MKVTGNKRITRGCAGTNSSCLLMVLVVITILSLSYEPTHAQGRPATLVEVCHVEQLQFRREINLVGRTEAIRKGSIVSEVTGRVISIDANEGRAIKAKEPLITIDPERMRLALNAKEAEASQALAQAKLAASNAKRIDELFEQNLVPETTRDSARAWVHITEHQHKKLEAERKKLKYDLDGHIIRAPYDGYTLRKMIDVGEWVNPGTPVYAMVDLSEVLVTVDLPERYYSKLTIGAAARIELASGDNNELTILGNVTGVARSASKESHTFPVIVTVGNEDGKLAGGRLVRVNLSLDEGFESLAIPKDAILRNGNATSIYVVVDGKAQPVSVKIQGVQGENVAVSGNGLTIESIVVIRGNERIYPGSAVTYSGQSATDSSIDKTEPGS